LCIGVIGTGLMGRLHAANLAFRVDGTELAAVCDIDRAAAVACAEHCEIDSSYDDYRDLLSHPGSDAVAVCTPPGTHGAITAADLAEYRVIRRRPPGRVRSRLRAAMARRSAWRRSPRPRLN